MTRRLPQVPPPAPSSRPRRRAPAVRAVRLLRLMALTAMCGGCDPETPLKPIACEPDIGRFRWSPDGAVVGVEVEIGNLDPCPDPTATWRVDATEVPACTTALVPDTGEARATTDCDVPRTAQEVCVVVFTGSMSAADRCEELSFECPPPVLRLDGDWASGDPLSLVEGPQLIRGVVEAEGDDPGLEVSAQALDADGVETARATAPSIGADGAFELLVDTDPDTDRVVVTAERTDCDEQMVLERAVRVRPAGAGPTCALLAPEDGGVSAVGLPVVFEMSAADAEDPANALRYALRSDRDGELGRGRLRLVRLCGLLCRGAQRRLAFCRARVRRLGRLRYHRWHQLRSGRLLADGLPGSGWRRLW
jgi:hypothetical protein